MSASMLTAQRSAMPFTASTRIPLAVSAVLWVLLLGACPAPPPAPTVATVSASRDGVTTIRAGQSQPVSAERRIEEGTEVRTAAGARAALFTDSGAWVLLDQSSAATFREGALELSAGRAWIDARGGDPIKILAAHGEVTLTAQGAGLSVSTGADATQVYCAAGQATWQAKGGGGRLESGISLLYKDGAANPAKETAQALWDDWTLGLAEPGPLRPPEPAGVGQLAARRADEIGSARTPLIVRRHEVRVRITGDLAETEVEQTFFNPRSEVLDGVYAVRLPPAAILSDFAVGDEDSGVVSASVLPRTTGSAGRAAAQLEWAGAGRYRGLLTDIPAGKTRVVRLRYAEWLAHRAHPAGARRSYLYPMGQSAAATAGEVPNLGEFSLEVDLSAAQAGGLEAGMGAHVEGSKVILRRSDFRPRADFVLDLLDPEERKEGALEAYRGEAQADGTRYLLTQPVLLPGPAGGGLDLLLVLDVSAGTDPARLDLARTAAQALLRQLGPADRVGVLALSVTARSLGKEALAPATPARIDELTEALGKEVPGGGTDLLLGLSRAVGLLPAPGAGQGGRSAVVYLGDGRPTVGALLPGELRDALLRLGPLPRIAAVAVGSDANIELLEAISEGGAGAAAGRGVIRIEDRPEAARAALHLFTLLSQPALTGVTAALGEDADVIYPETPVTLIGGEPLQVVARLRRDRHEHPDKLVLRGQRDGQPFVQEFKLAISDAADGHDLARRWGQARLLRLLQRGAGKEAASDIGTRYAVVTPWTALVLGGDASQGYAQLIGEEERGTFVPPALREQPPADAAMALEGGVSTQTVRAWSVDQLYGQALAERQAPARVCYDRKAAGHPELSGRVNLKVKIALDGAVVLAKVAGSTLRAPDVEACIERAVAGLRLPAAPDGKPHEIDFALQLEQDVSDGPRSCSAASRAYLSARRALWRERLLASPGVGGAMSVWRGAQARCELRSWIDRRALLDLMRPMVGATAEQVDLYHRFDSAQRSGAPSSDSAQRSGAPFSDSAQRGGAPSSDGQADQGEVQEYLRREILRAVRTQADVRAAQAGLSLDGGIEPLLLKQELAKAHTVEGQIAVLRRFLQLSPRAIALKVQLLALLEQAGQKAEAYRLCDSLRGDPGADAAVRQAIGEFLIRAGDGAEGARALSEIVEFAPFDPWARRRLGDLYEAHGLHDAAYREYQILGWLMPQDESVFLLLSNAAAGAGRTDEALRLSARVAEAVGAGGQQSGPASLARTMHAVRLARLIDEARQRDDKNLLGQLLLRGRSDGVPGYAGGLLLALTTAHPDAGLALYLGAPGTAQKEGERAAITGAAVGIEAQRFERAPGGAWGVSVRRQPGSQGAKDAELLAILAGGEKGVQRVKLHLLAGQDRQDFVLADGQLSRR